MKLLTCSIALLFSLCTYGQSKLLQDLDTNINHPVWVAHFLNKKEQARIALPKDYAEPFLSDTVLIAVPQGESTMDIPVPTRKEDDQVIRQDNQKLPDQPASCDLVAFSSNTGRVLWYVSELPEKFAVSVCKNNVICSQPGGIQCFDLLTGKTNWWHPTKDKVVYSSPDLPFFVYPVDSLLYVLYTPAYYSVDTAHSFFIMSAKTGKVYNSFSKGIPKDITTISYVYRNYVVLSNSSNLICFNTITGKELWSLKTYKQGVNATSSEVLTDRISCIHFLGDTVFFNQSLSQDWGKPDSCYLWLKKISTGKVLMKKLFTVSYGNYYEFKAVQHYPPTPWYDGDTAYLYTEGGIAKYNMRNLQKIWEKELPRFYGRGMNYIFTDNRHFYYTYSDSLFVCDKLNSNSSIKKLNYSFRVTDVSQNNSLLFLSYNGYPNINYDDLKHLTDFSVLDKSNLQYTPLQRDNMYLLLPDYKNGFLYLIDRQKGLVKVQLPK